MTTRTTTSPRTIVERLSVAYTMRKRDGDGAAYYVIELPFDDPLYKLAAGISYKACSDFGQTDDWYSLLGDVLDQLQHGDWTTEDEAHEVVADQEPDVYNADLLAWVGRSLNNAEWVDEAMQELGARTLFAALAYGQQRQREDWAHGIVDGIFDYTQHQEDEE